MQFKLFVSLFSFIFCLGVLAQDPKSFRKFSDVDNKTIARNLDVMSFILKLGDDVVKKEFLPLTDKVWAEDLAEASMELMKRAYAEGPQEKKLIEKFKSAFNWDALWQKTKSMAKYVKSFSRHKGLSAAFILVATAPSDLYFPAILTAIGRPELIPLVTILPITPIGLWAENSIRSFQSNKRIKEAMGGAQAFSDFLAGRKDMLNQMGIRSSDYLHPLSSTGNDLEAIVISKSNVFQKYLSKLGFKQNGITYGSVKKYLKENDLLDDVSIKSIMTQDLPEEIKAGQIIFHLRYQRTEEMAHSVLAEFHSGLRSIDLTRGQGALWDAYQSLGRVAVLTWGRRRMAM